MKNEPYKETFELTGEHIAMLRRCYISLNQPDTYWGAIGLDVKRPFGNKDITSDIAEILGLQRIEIDSGEEVWPAGTTERMHKLYCELETALQIVLRTGSFEPGLYGTIGFGRNWELVN